jgi:membrane dipeptidase
MNIPSIRLCQRFALSLVALAGLPACTTMLDKLGNPINDLAQRRAAMEAVPQRDRDFHNGLFIADMHCDSLLWDRDLMVRHDYGHLDVPRMVEGNVAFQILAMPTEVPVKIGNLRVGNTVGVLTFLETGRSQSNFDRAIGAADELDTLIARSAGGKHPIRLIKTRDDLRRFRRDFDASPRDQRPIGTFLGLEGAHGLDDDHPDNFTHDDVRKQLQTLAARGYRTIGPAHFHGTAGVGSAQHPTDHDAGLSMVGLEALMEMERLGIVIDLTHSARPSIEDIMTAWRAGKLKKPLISSHTGVRPFMPVLRALPNRYLTDVAMTGGVIGISYFKTFKESMSVEEIALSCRKVVDVLNTAGYIGINHVGLGSDYDGTVKVPFDASELVLLTSELRKPKYGFSDSDIRKIAGDNLYRVLLKTLPES